MIDVYEKDDYLKVTFSNKTKRLRCPPQDFELLMNKVLEKFPSLRLLKEHPFRPQQVDFVWRGSLIADSMQLQQMQR